MGGEDFLNYEIDVINIFNNGNDDLKMSEEYLIELINRKLASLIIYYELQKWNLHICLI